MNYPMNYIQGISVMRLFKVTLENLWILKHKLSDATNQQPILITVTITYTIINEAIIYIGISLGLNDYNLYRWYAIDRTKRQYI